MNFQETPLIIRRAQAADQEEWLRMRASLWPDSPEEEHRREMEDYLYGVIYAAFVAERPVGGLAGFLEASLRTYADGCDSSPTAYIEGWYVDSDRRHRGVGRQLVEAAEAWAVTQGCHEMGSDCEIDNTASFQAHLALGFMEAGRNIHFCKRLSADPVGAPEPSLDFMYILRAVRPGYFEASAPEEDAIMEKHFEYLQQGVRQGDVLLAGPCLDDACRIVLLQAPSLQSAQEFVHNDPAVKHGVLAPELHPMRFSHKRPRLLA